MGGSAGGCGAGEGSGTIRGDRDMVEVGRHIGRRETVDSGVAYTECKVRGEEKENAGVMVDGERIVGLWR